ncbi:MAG: 30S ribosomal protein S14 [Nanoarchaeota archaeon]|nr:30S ribosomal protein S14 [Nanoarchaeota archaeon]
MTAKDWKKSFKQVAHKKAESTRQLKFNKPVEKKYGRGRRVCSICGRRGALIRRYELNVCRQCFKDIANGIGFKKF